VLAGEEGILAARAAVRGVEERQVSVAMFRDRIRRAAMVTVVKKNVQQCLASSAILERLLCSVA